MGKLAGLDLQLRDLFKQILKSAIWRNKNSMNFKKCRTCIQKG